MGCGYVSCEPLDFIESVIFGLDVGGGSDVVLDGFLFPCACCWRGKFPAAVDLEEVVLLFVCVGDHGAVA